MKKKPASEGAAAVKAADASLNEALGRWDAVNQVAASLRELRQRNHFAEQIEQVMRGRRQ